MLLISYLSDSITNNPDVWNHFKKLSEGENLTTLASLTALSTLGLGGVFAFRCLKHKFSETGLNAKLNGLGCRLQQMSNQLLVTFREEVSSDNQNLNEQDRLNNSKRNQLLSQLNTWFSIHQIPFDLLKVNALTTEDQNTLKVWLRRLARTKDYQNNQKNLALIVCNLLNTVFEDETFKTVFISQAEANNSHCQDRSAMALNEIYIAWQIHCLPKNTFLKDKLELLVRAAKTLTLRRLINEKIKTEEIKNGHTKAESVEIFLYYEINLKNELNLLTAIEQMAHETIGQRTWMNIDFLKKEVQENYIIDLIVIPAFETLIKQEKSYLNLWDIHQKIFHQQLEDLLNNHNLSVKELNDQINILAQSRKQKEIEIVKKWLKQVN